MQTGGVTTTDVYSVSGRVIIDGVDIGADVETVSLGRDIPSGLPGDSGFTSASGRVTATWGDTVSDRTDHPWSTDPVWPPQPSARVEVILSDGTREWTQFKGVVVNPSGSTSTRTISFGILDKYRSLDTLVTVPALSNIMPSLTDANTHRYIAMQSVFLTDFLLRAGGRYATPARGSDCFVSVPFQGSTWPDRGECRTSIKQVADEIGQAFPNWDVTRYGLAVQNVIATYTPWSWSGLDLTFNRPLEVTQEIVETVGSTFLYITVGSGRLALAFSASQVFARYYPSSGSFTTLVQANKGDATRVAVRFSRSGSTLSAQLRLRHANGSLSTMSSGTAAINSGDLTGKVTLVQASGTGTQGAFQAGYPATSWGPLSESPNAVIHASPFGRNTLVGVPPQINANVLDLLNDQADAEFAQWWIDEHDVLQWWDRGLLAQQPIVGTLNSTDHVQELSWSHDHETMKRRVHVKYQKPEVTQRWRTNLTLWEGRGETLEQGDESEIFVNVPNDEIWLGVDTENPTRYSANTGNYWALNRGIRTVMGGIAIDDDGNERLTNSIIPSVRRVTDETYVFEHNITALASDEQAALEIPSEYVTDTAVWARWRNQGLPILRGKKRILFQDATYTSEIVGDSSAPDYTHDHGWWLQELGYVGQTADYAAASLTQPNPRIDGLDIMPVFALQVGDHILIKMPDVAELELTGVVTSINIDADLSNGSAEQSISILPTNVETIARRWKDFGATYGGTTWQGWADLRSGGSWSDFGTSPIT